MNTKSLVRGVFVLLILAFTFVAVFENSQVGSLSAQLQSKTSTTQPAVVNAYPSDAMIPFPCCQTFPTSFAVGSQGENAYRFNVTSVSPLEFVRNETTTYTSGGVLVAFKVYQVNASPLRTEWANFTWSGSFSETAPFPSNAILFDGAVEMNWVVNSSILYLHILTK